MDTLLPDLRYALRSLRKSPGFTVVAVLTLALGIGATTAVFSVVNGVLLHPLPFTEQDRLFTLLERGKAGGQRLPSYPTFLDWQRQATRMDLGYARGAVASLRGTEGVENVLVAYVSPGFLSVLGARPAVGRTFLPEEERAGRGDVAVLTYRFWMRHFGGDPSAVGKTLTLGSRTYTVVGVLPRGATYPTWAELWIPVAAIAGTDRTLTERDFHADGRLIGRLHDGVSLAAARSELDAIAQRLAAEYPETNGDWPAVDAAPIGSEILGDVRPRLLVLMAAVALVLLIACANVASLSLARAAARTREMAIRSALGAGRVRVVRQLLTESAVVAVSGGVLGLAAGALGVRAVQHAAPTVLPRLGEVALDGGVVAFTLGVSLLTALLVGLAPAFRAAAPKLVDSLREGAAAAGSGRRHRRVRAALVTAEIAVALVLVAGAGLLVRSFWRLQQVDPGFNPTHLVSMNVDPPVPEYAEPAKAAALYARLADAARQVPGVQGVALSNFLPLTGSAAITRVRTAGEPTDAARERGAIFRTISPNYFQLMEIPLRAGRAFTTADLSQAGTVAIVNEAFVRAYFRGQSPLGQSVTIFKSAQGRADFGEPMQLTVVGIAGDVRHFGLDTDPFPEVFVPYTANPWTHMELVVRTRGDAARLIPALERAVLDVEPAIPIAGAGAGFRTMDQLVETGLGARRFNTSLLTVFAMAALLLAAIGIYGLMAYTVAQRTREIGLRMALGAQRGDVLRLVVGQGMRLAAVGIALGLIGSFAATRLMASMLYDVTATDPVTLASVAALLGGVALLACWLPARRAMRVDPTVALRSE